MSFKENLLKKIKIDIMSKNVIDSTGPPDSGRKVDKETMRRLLEMSSYKSRMERDLELYISEVTEEGRGKILVLDNDLAIYNTTVEDVTIRKTPTVKEMLNIRNIIKILNDADVVVSKKEESVRTIRKECIEMLDLSFDKSDLDEIEKDGSISLERGYTDGVIECLSLFAELIGYRSAPKAFKARNHKIIGALTRKKSGELVFGPIVIYSIIHNFIKLIDDQIGSFDKERIELMHRIATGDEKASIEGHHVFQYLKEKVIGQKLLTIEK